MNKTAVIYARCSTEKQYPSSIDRQIAICKAYATERGLHVVGTYIDRGISGETIHRPGLTAMLSRDVTPKFDFVLVESIDRLARGRLVMLAALDVAREIGAQIVDVNREREGLSEVERVFREIEKCDRCGPIVREIMLGNVRIEDIR